jgi:outer membrane lipoprotein SlyB
MKPNFSIFSVIFLCLCFTACGPKRPALYPNATLEQVGKETAERDIDECLRLAEAHVGSGKGGQVAREGVRGAAIGAAAGAAVTAVLGGDVGRSAAAGAAGGGAAGTTSGLFDAGNPDPVYRGFVDKCLRDKGYDVIGWK